MIESELAAAATSNLELRLLCPSCGGVCSSRSGFRCDQCDHTVGGREGFRSFTSSSEFYEHQCTNTLKLPLVDRVYFALKPFAYVDFLCHERHRRNRFFRRAVGRLPRKAAVLDVGCGGGMETWCRLGKVVGLSNSLSGTETGPRGILRMCSRGSLGWAAIPRRKLRLHRRVRRHRAL